MTAKLVSVFGVCFSVNFLCFFQFRRVGIRVFGAYNIFFYLPRFSIYEECEDARNFKDAFGGCIRGRRVFAGGRAQGGHRIRFIAGAGEIVAFMRIHFSSGVRMPMFVLCPYIALYMRFSWFRA